MCDYVSIPNNPLDENFLGGLGGSKNYLSHFLCRNQYQKWPLAWQKNWVNPNF
jgi:hypothetical protein